MSRERGPPTVVRVNSIQEATMRPLLPGRHTPIVSALCAVGLAALAFGAASLSASPSASPVVQRLHLVERIQHQQFLDLGKHGQSAGDRLVTRSDILDAK